jgi:uncharacterized protein YkwD
LAIAAEEHSQDQAEHHQLSHTGSDGTSPQARAIAAATNDKTAPQYVSENVLFGARDEQHALKLWLTSPGHRANILDPHAQITGVGSAMSDNVEYVTQMFARVGEGAAPTCFGDDAE